VHILARSSKGELSATIRDFKKFTSKKIIDAINNENESRREWMMRLFTYAAKRQNKKGNYQFWTHENHAVEVFSNTFIEEKVNYIHNNPVRSGIVNSPEEYIYSIARFYAEEKGIMDVIPVDFRWKTVR